MQTTHLFNSHELRSHVLTKHIIEEHIEVEDEELKERFLEEDKSCKLYTKFEDKEVAEDAISTALINNLEKIDNWDKTTGKNFLKLFFKADSKIGYGYNQKGIRYDLQWLTLILCKNNNNKGFRIKSAYPS